MQPTGRDTDRFVNVDDREPAERQPPQRLLDVIGIEPHVANEHVERLGDVHGRRRAGDIRIPKEGLHLTGGGFPGEGRDERLSVEDRQ